MGRVQEVRSYLGASLRAPWDRIIPQGEVRIFKY